MNRPHRGSMPPLRHSIHQPPSSLRTPMPSYSPGPSGYNEVVDESIPAPPTASRNGASTNYNTVHKIPERYICLFCSNLQTQPVLVSCCGLHFCNGCLTKWFREQGKKCPHCRQTGITHMLNKERVRDINELKVYCSNKSVGCVWEGDLGTLEDHLSSKCDYTQLDCPQMCKMKILRKGLNKHMKDGCLCRKYRCEHCGLQGTYHSITGECGEFGPCELHGEGHYSECGSFPLTCPNQCSEIIKRRDVAAHRETCPLEPVECPFSDTGCTETVARKDLDKHTATSDHHLILMTKAFKELKRSLEETRQEVKKLKQEVASMKPGANVTREGLMPTYYYAEEVPSPICCIFDT